MDQSYLTGLITERPQNFAWFLGAGASRSAGLPTAADIIWEMKKQYFIQEEREKLTRQDLQIAAVKERIQAFMNSRGFPAEGDPAEYESYFQKIFGDNRERQRAYIARVMNEGNATLTVGNRVMGGLLGADIAKAVFTTNFDSIVEKGVAEVTGKSLAAFHLEGAPAALQAMNNNEFPIYVKLHGDFRYDSIKNLSEDLATQNKELGDCFKLAGTRFGFVVAGYSGRDASVMRLFKEALDGLNPFPHGLYWTGVKGAIIPHAVEELLEYAKAKGVSAHYVGVETYDTLMLRIWRGLRVTDALDAKVRRTQAASVNIPLPPAGTRKPAIEFNALLITKLPRKCQKVVFDRDPDWTKLNEIRRSTNGALVLTKADGVLAWGSSKDVKKFCPPHRGIDEYDLSARLSDLSNNLQVKGFLEEALCKALVRDKPLLTRNLGQRSFVFADALATDQGAFSDLNDIIGKPQGKIVGLFAPADEFHAEQEQVYWAEALQVSLDEKAGRFWLVINPDIWIWPARARRLATDFMSDRRKDRYNQKFDSLLKAWVPLILGDLNEGQLSILSPFDTGSEIENPSFEISAQRASSLWRVG